MRRPPTETRTAPAGGWPPWSGTCSRAAICWKSPAEPGCGPGLWTRHLAGCASTVTAIDAAPEMIALARQQVTAVTVTFVTADVLTWAPPRRFDTIFFAFWLSHVPAAEFGQFWSLLRSALSSGGRVLFVDDQPAAAALETYVAGSVRSWSGACATEPATGSSR